MKPALKLIAAFAILVLLLQPATAVAICAGAVGENVSCSPGCAMMQQHSAASPGLHCLEANPLSVSGMSCPTSVEPAIPQIFTASDSISIHPASLGPVLPPVVSSGGRIVPVAFRAHPSDRQGMLQVFRI